MSEVLHSVKGWCPGAHRPMMSGDGLVCRIRPRCGEISRAQALGLCALAQKYGCGVLDLTSRANIQIRAIKEDDYSDVLNGLMELGLLDADQETESRRNIMVTPVHSANGRTARLYGLLAGALGALPKVPAKFGFALDDGPAPLLTQDPADIRIETAQDGGLVLRLDGMAMAMATSEDTLIKDIAALMGWFVSQPNPRRMAQAVKAAGEDLPFNFDIIPAASAAQMSLGQSIMLSAEGEATGIAYGAAFGQVHADDLAALLERTPANTLRITPWRSFVLCGEGPLAPKGFITDDANPMRRIDACAGAPYCTSSTINTRALAEVMLQASNLPPTGSLHISGCPKGCARARAADLTLVGQSGKYNLVVHGCAWDEPVQTALTKEDLLNLNWENINDIYL